MCVLLSLLLVPRLTDAEITSNILLVLLAGHDTSSTTLTRCLSNLHDHPWVLDKLRAEQAAVRASRGEALTPNALKEMPFADAVLRQVSVCVRVGGPSDFFSVAMPPRLHWVTCIGCTCWKVMVGYVVLLNYGGL